jgi:hypothetical protein
LPKAPTARAEQIQNLKELYQELLTLRSQVYQEERLGAERPPVEVRPQRGRNPAHGKSNRGKQRLVALASGRMFSWQPDTPSFINVRADFLVVGNEIAVADLSDMMMGSRSLAGLSPHL